MVFRSAFVVAALSARALAWTAPATLFDPLIAAKLLHEAETVNAPPLLPSITSTDGKWMWTSPNNWTAGFLPATLYQLAKRECLCPSSTLVGDSVPNWLEYGRTWTGPVATLHWNNTVGHDVGYVSFPFVDEVALFPANASAKRDLIDFALELSSRWSDVVGATSSWDSPANSTDFLVIIDNMINLELLLQAHLLTGNQTFYDIAIKHADTTLKNGIRSDWGTWQVVVYDSETGAVKVKRTSQGYTDDTTWTRGHSWAIHGYTRMYQYTKLSRFLDAARNLAAYFLRRAAENPSYMLWDFDAPAEERSADSSAAMVAAAGLQALAATEASLFNTTGAKKWMSGAQMLISQTAGYAWRPSWESVLANATRDNNGRDQPFNTRSKNTGLPYADYFWVKNGNYLLETKQVKCPNGKVPTHSACGSDLHGPSF
ncbi:Six-hairpin glycosidase [Auriculariales sp. MPI-PUGE-AT-0066]|nr:Six-hairpin glycosidase [Auriculariales sp. MPI-PUGE-AT-0066]